MPSLGIKGPVTVNGGETHAAPTTVFPGIEDCLHARDRLQKEHRRRGAHGPLSITNAGINLLNFVSRRPGSSLPLSWRIPAFPIACRFIPALGQTKSSHSVCAGNESKLAERVGFEPTIPVKVYTLSKRAPSATRPSLRRANQPFHYKRCSAARLTNDLAGRVRPIQVLCVLETGWPMSF